MNIIVSLLLNNDKIQRMIRKRSKLNHYVNYYLNNGHRQLEGRSSSNCMYVMSSGLLPILMTYENLKYGTGDIFGAAVSPHVKKKNFLIRKNEFNDLDYAFDFACGLLERNIPELIIGCNSIDMAEENKISRHLYGAVKDYARAALKRNHRHLSSFWVLLSFYYKQPPEFDQPLMPSADNPMQLIPYSYEETKRLADLLYGMLDHFCKKNRVINALEQEVESTAMRQNDLESSFYYTNMNTAYSPVDFASKCNFPDIAKDELARDMYGYSLNIESWEGLLYFNPATHVLEYLPRRIAYYQAMVKVYYRVLQTILDGEDDVNLLRDAMKGSLLLYISNVHIFLNSVYLRGGEITENAEYLLAGMRAFKRNSPTRLISPRGKSIWHELVPGMRRRGKQFW
ncbi:hypothetical protein AAEX28_06560 [Lentisphaerota bacterium WC36G]|nr:hypothetical protein LJT99_09425 [Lentisphaerae bacterium WC36]